MRETFTSKNSKNNKNGRFSIIPVGTTSIVNVSLFFWWPKVSKQAGGKQSRSPSPLLERHSIPVKIPHSSDVSSSCAFTHWIQKTKTTYFGFKNIYNGHSNFLLTSLFHKRPHLHCWPKRRNCSCWLGKDPGWSKWSVGPVFHQPRLPLPRKQRSLQLQGRLQRTWLMLHRPARVRGGHQNW